MFPENEPTNEEQLEALKKALDGLVGESCWSVILDGWWDLSADMRTGSAAELSFGSKVPAGKFRKTKNRYISREQQNYLGEFVLYLSRCDWKIECGDAVVCSSQSQDYIDGLMIQGLRALIGLPVKGVLLSSPSLDLTLKFDRGYSLIVTCLPLQPEEINYKIWDHKVFCFVESEGKLWTDWWSPRGD